ncbi:MAG: HetZ-related protein 2 [Chloroflexaceae bacterium]|nr:HetZ-related protein 2 [Chloroflexaceae bacterium]
MKRVADEIEQHWDRHLQATAASLPAKTRESIGRWLIGDDRGRFEALNPEQLAIAQQAMGYRYRILQQRYLNLGPSLAYRNLIKRLASITLVRQKIRTWVALSRDRQQQVAEVLQEIIQEMLNSDRYIQGQLAWIAQCTQDERLRNSLLLASLEEYCLRPIRNQPLLSYRFVNYLRRQSRSGITQAPRQEMIRLVSEEIGIDDESDASASLFDYEAVALYQEAQAWEERQLLRAKVQGEFEHYLVDKVGEEARQWLRLYLQGRSQESIAQEMNLPIRQIYRLREKVSYHALRGFALKAKPELVAEWLEISLQEHNLGLTPSQWQEFWEGLSETQRQLIAGLKAGKSWETLAQELKCKSNQAIAEWGKLYLAAQELRTGGKETPKQPQD